MSELYATAIFLFAMFALLGGSVWVGLALVGVAERPEHVGATEGRMATQVYLCCWSEPPEMPRLRRPRPLFLRRPVALRG